MSYILLIMCNSLFQEKLKRQANTEHRILMTHFREVNAGNGCRSACQRSYRSARLQHGNNGCLIRRKLLFCRHPFLHLCCCHPTPLACAPAKCIDKASFTFRLQLWRLSNTYNMLRERSTTQNNKARQLTTASRNLDPSLVCCGKYIS